YAFSGVVWTMPADGGEPRRLHDGDSVAVDPQGRYLVVTFGTADQIALTRVSLTGDPDQQIPVSGDFRVARSYLMPNAIGPHRRHHPTEGQSFLARRHSRSAEWLGHADH